MPGTVSMGTLVAGMATLLRDKHRGMGGVAEAVKVFCKKVILDVRHMLSAAAG